MDEHLSHSSLKSSLKFKNNELLKKDFFPKTKCIHSRKIMNLCDFSEDEKEISLFEKHATDCDDCQKASIAARFYLKMTDEAIPLFRPSSEMLEGLHTEMGEIFSRLNFKNAEETFTQKWAWLKKTEIVVADFFNILISWKMIPVYLIAGILFMFLIH